MNTAYSNSISLSTMIGNASMGVYVYAAASNTVTQCYLQGDSALRLEAGSDFNAISLSTMIGAALGLYASGSDSNTITGSYMRGGERGAFLWTGADYNTISLSTMIGVSCGLQVNAADSNAVSRSYIWGGLGGAMLDNGSDFNAISLSTMVSDNAGWRALFILQGSSNVLLNSYVRGAEAAIISGSTGTIIGGSIFIATNTAGSALVLAGGSVNLTITTSTLLSPSLGRGLYLDSDNAGVVSLSSVIFTGAARGLEIAAQRADFEFSVDSITFRALASGATAVHFLGGTFVSTFTLANFESTNIGANVSGAALNPASRITMNASYGARTSQTYENDPSGLVDWVGYEPYPGCAVTRNVGYRTPYATITAGLAALPQTLTGHSCVVIRDGAAYNEQVTIKNFTNNGSSITILADPGSGLRPVVSPPAASTAAFVVNNSSVNIFGVDVVPTISLPYGIRISSSYVSVSSVNVQDASFIWQAGVLLSSWTTVSHTSVTVQAGHGFWLPGSTMSVISYSSAAGTFPLYLTNASTNTIQYSYFDGRSGQGSELNGGSRYNTIADSTMTLNSGIGNQSGLYVAQSNWNTVVRSSISNGSQIGLFLFGFQNHSFLNVKAG